MPNKVLRVNRVANGRLTTMNVSHCGTKVIGVCLLNRFYSKAFVVVDDKYCY